MSSVVSAELSAKMAVWRAKALTGELTLEEQQQAVAYMRGERKGASITGDQKKRTKAKKEIKSADAMLSELGI